MIRLDSTEDLGPMSGGYTYADRRHVRMPNGQTAFVNRYVDEDTAR